MNLIYLSGSSSAHRITFCDFSASSGIFRLFLLVLALTTSLTNGFSFEYYFDWIFFNFFVFLDRRRSTINNITFQYESQFNTE
jgi:hypothetical protein